MKVDLYFYEAMVVYNCIIANLHFRLLILGWHEMFLMILIISLVEG